MWGPHGAEGAERDSQRPPEMADEDWCTWLRCRACLPPLADTAAVCPLRAIVAGAADKPLLSALLGFAHAWGPGQTLFHFFFF